MIGNVPVIDNVGRYIINFLKFLVENLISWTETLVYIFSMPLSSLLDELGANVELISNVFILVFGAETSAEILSFNLLALIFGVGVTIVIVWTIIKWFTDAFL